MEHVEPYLDSSFDNSDRHDSIEEALRQAGLFDVRTPRKGTKAYDRVVKVAEDYITEIKLAEKLSSSGASRLSSLEINRRKLHDQLTTMLLGKTRSELSKEKADQVSNFAAYITGNNEYIDTW